MVKYPSRGALSLIKGSSGVVKMLHPLFMGETPDGDAIFSPLWCLSWRFNLRPLPEAAGAPVLWLFLFFVHVKKIQRIRRGIIHKLKAQSALAPDL